MYSSLSYVAFFYFNNTVKIIIEAAQVTDELPSLKFKSVLSNQIEFLNLSPRLSAGTIFSSIVG